MADAVGPAAVENGDPVETSAIGAGRVTATAIPVARRTPTRARAINRVRVRAIGPMRVVMFDGTRGHGACYGAREVGGDDRIRTGE